MLKEKNEAYLNVFSSKQLGELLFMSSSSVAMRKLVRTICSKSGTNPVTYNLTPEGKPWPKDFQLTKIKNF